MGLKMNEGIMTRRQKGLEVARVTPISVIAFVLSLGQWLQPIDSLISQVQRGAKIEKRGRKHIWAHIFVRTLLRRSHPSLRTLSSHYAQTNMGVRRKSKQKAKLQMYNDAQSEIPELEKI